MGRKFTITLMLVWVLTAYGCAALDAFFTPQDGHSMAESIAQPIAAAGGPWGEVALAGVMLLQNMYLGGRKLQQIQKRRNGTPSA